jgi:hypothetical protein
MQKEVKKIQNKVIKAYRKIQKIKMIKEKIRKMQKIIRMINQNKKITKIIRIIRNKSKERIIKNKVLPQKRTRKTKVLTIKVQYQ